MQEAVIKETNEAIIDLGFTMVSDMYKGGVLCGASFGFRDRDFMYNYLSSKVDSVFEKLRVKYSPGIELKWNTSLLRTWYKVEGKIY